jgi:hypothetical protein
MAGNKKIFDLPLRTGLTPDDRFVVVDSGNTTTYSVKLSDLQDGTGVNTLEGLTGNLTFSGTNIDITASGTTIFLSGGTGGGGGGKFIQSTGSTTSNIIPDYYSLDSIRVQTIGQETSYSFIGGGQNNEIAPSDDRYKGNTIIGGFSNVIDGGQYWATILGSYDSYISGIGLIPRGSVIIGGEANFTYGWSHTIAGEANDARGYYYSVILGGYNNYVNVTDDRGTTIIGGKNHDINQGARVGIINGSDNIINSGTDSIIVAGASNTMTTTINGAIVGGKSNTISASTSTAIIASSGSTLINTDYSAVVGGFNSDITNNDYSGIFAGIDNTISGTGARNVVIGGDDNDITGGDQGAIIGGIDNTIAASGGDNNVIVGGDTNTINTAIDSVIIGGANNTVNNSRCVILGCSNVTTSANDQVHVFNLFIQNYASLDFVDDAAAAAGDVEIGQVYHNNGALRIRLT